MGMVLTLLFTSMFTLTFDIQPAEAWTGGTIYIRADGSVEPSGTPISSIDNITYTLNSSISCNLFEGYAIVVERSNIIVDGSGHTVQGSSVAGFGFNITGVSHVRIMNVEIKDFVYYGIAVLLSSNIIIQENNITNTGEGIYIANCSDNSVYGNNITNNGRGIYVKYSPNTTICGNNIANNDEGIGITFSYYNTIYHNNFINNTVQAFATSWPMHASTWDDGYPSGGNYWSNYNGTDSYSGPNQDQPSSDGDGIGDTPYNVTVTDTQQDRYPLMNSWTPTETMIEVLGVSHPVTIESNTTITEIATTDSTLSFTSSGPTGEKGYIRLIFPMVNTTEIHVYVDGVKITPDINTNGTHYFIYFEFTLSRHYLRIRFAPDWWPMFRHDLSHTAYSTSIAPNTNNTLWTYTTGDDVWSSPAVVDGKVYVGSYDNKTYCLDASDGALIWNYTTGDDVTSSPAVVDGKVYVGSYDDKVYCLNASAASMTPDEREIWNYTTGGNVHSSPAVADGKVYVGSFNSLVHCLNASTGALIWNYTTGGTVHSSPAVADGKVYIGCSDKKVYCLNASAASMTPDEREIWNYTTGGSVYPSPAVVDGKVYVGSFDNKTYCLDDSDGALIWNYTTGGWVFSSPAVVHGRVYVGSYDDKVYCLNASAASMTPDEREIWNYTTGGNVYSSPAVADGKVYVGSVGGKVYCLNASDGAPIWSYKTAPYTVSSSPAVADGRVYVGSFDNKVYAFGICGVNITNVVPIFKGQVIDQAYQTWDATLP